MEHPRVVGVDLESHVSNPMHDPCPIIFFKKILTALFRFDISDPLGGKNEKKMPSPANHDLLPPGLVIGRGWVLRGAMKQCTT